MREYINMVKLLSMISKSKNQVDIIYRDLIDSDTSRFMASIYNNTSKCTLNGVDIDTTTNAIINIDRTVRDSLSRLEKLQAIKDEVNQSHTIMIHEVGKTDEIEVSVAKALVLMSPVHRKYRLDYIDKLVGDYNKVMTTLRDHQESALHQDKIDTYVRAKMASLSIVNNDASSSTYEAFAKEYVDANKFSILDPLNIAEKAQKYKSDILDYYDDIDAALKVFNATCKIWIDLESDSEYWGKV